MTQTQLCRVTGLVSWLFMHAVAAQDDESVAQASAREHFQRGVEYYTEGDFRTALIELKRAYELQATYKLLYNLGQVAYELRDYAGAERYYHAYLTEGADELSPEREAEVKAELERLRTRVASLRLRPSLPGAVVHVDERAIFSPESGPIRVSAGQLHLVAEKAGYAPVRRTIEVSGGEEREVPLDFGLPLSSQRSERPAQSKSASTLLPWVTGVTSAVIAVGGAGMGYSAYNTRAARNKQLQQVTTRAELDRLSSQTKTKALITDVLLGTALAGAVITVILVATAGGSESAPPARSEAKHALPPSAF